MFGVTDQLAVRLLDAADLDDHIASIDAIPGGWTYRLWSIVLSSGMKLVMRQYRWPHGSPDLDRPTKEQYQHRLLREANVPVAEILSQVVEADSSASLLSYGGKAGR